jgi:hypothetical protein
MRTQNDYDYDAEFIDKLDAELQNLPKEIYDGKLLEICAHNENQVCWYRDILCYPAKQQAGCPTRKLMNRKLSITVHVLSCMQKIVKHYIHSV